MTAKHIHIKGARVHNLKNIDIKIPRDKFVVMTGLSGSGKSSLAFDTLYAEGQRRYVESLSAYARQFLGQMDKPDVDYIEGLSPAISIDQKTTSRNPRSTVGTVTEVYDYLRLLYARIGIPHCPECGKQIVQQTIDQMVDQILSLPEGTRILLLAPLIRGRKGEHTRLLSQIAREGYVRARVDGEIVELTEEINLDKKKKHTIEVVVDRLTVRPDAVQRLTGSLETVMELSGGLAIVSPVDGDEILFSQKYACPDCGISIEELTPRMFSFNSPYGACPTCHGLGTLMEIDPDLVIPDQTLSMRKGAVNIPGWNSSAKNSVADAFMQALGAKYGFTMDMPFMDFPEAAREAVLNGTKGKKLDIVYERDGHRGQYHTPFEGLVPNLQRRYKQTGSSYMRGVYEQYMSNRPCPDCHGARLKPEVLAVTVGGVNIQAFTDLSIVKALDFLDTLALTERQEFIAHQILKEIRDRLGFMKDVGLSYLTLSRMAGSLSGGEAQRIRLATQIGSSLVGVMYILDEPSIGLHQRDNARLIHTLKNLRDLGNTLIVVEHDEETIREADHVVDIGPGAGIHGGEIIAQGTVRQIERSASSITGKYLSGRKVIPVPGERRKPNGSWLTVRGAVQNNLKEIDVEFPLGVMTCVTGVSGSGKSTLVNEILFKAAKRHIYKSMIKPGKHKSLEGLDLIDKVIDIDQSPIGRTPRSNPATYTGVFDQIRDLFAMTQEAKIRGYKKGRFSFNVKGGRCEACQGDGILKIEMHFLPDVYVSCDVCGGRRYNRETLEVRYKGKNIADVLEMTVEEALSFFDNIPRIKRHMQTLYDVGLGYIKLGQSSTTLSGGEAQRVKLASELSKRSTGRTLYILDEPTTGLHMDDVNRLVQVLQRLAEGGNTIIIIEHNLDIIKNADYIIDLGPEGGDEGGRVIATGTPEEVSRMEHSYTGQFLRTMLEPKPTED